MSQELPIEETDAPATASAHKGGSPWKVICLFLLAYLVTRLGSLNALPIFLDEAVHIQWAERLVNEGRLLRPVSAGRLLAVAVYALVLPFEDRLWTARALSSLAGAATLCFAMLLSNRLFGSRAAAVAGFLYLTSPFALVYDKLALSDGFLAASIAGLMWAFHALTQAPRSTVWRILVALLVALAILSKVSALFFFGFIPCGVLALSDERRRLASLAATPVACGLIVASPMLWAFVRSGREIGAQHVVDPMNLGAVLDSTLRDMGQWLVSYFTVPTLVMAAIALLFMRERRTLWLASAAIIPFVFFAAFSQPWSARYVLPALVPVLVLAAGGVAHVSNRAKPSIVPAATLTLALVAAAQAIPFSFALISDPASAPFPKDDRLQLVTGWPSGYGIREAAARLKVESANAPAIVFVDTGGTRTLPTSLAVLLSGDTAVRLIEGDFASAQVQAAMNESSRHARVLALLSPRPDFDFKATMPLANRLDVYQRPGGERVATLFEMGAASSWRLF